MIGTFDITASALVAQRTRLDVIAGNLANAEVTQQEDGTIRPYRRRFVTFMSGDGAGGPGVLDGPLAQARFWVLRPKWIRLIDNTVRFGFKEEWRAPQHESSA